MLAEVWKSDQKIIGENIKKARKAAKLTQEQFAEEMGGSIDAGAGAGTYRARR